MTRLHLATRSMNRGTLAPMRAFSQRSSTTVMAAMVYVGGLGSIAEFRFVGVGSII
jgi:hypothetical protein